MDLATLRGLIEYTNPWVESVVLLLMLIFIVFIMAKLLHDLVNRAMHYFEMKKYDFLPEIIEYGTYLVGFVLILIYVGIFKFALIIFLGVIIILLILSLLSFFLRIIPDYAAGRKLKHKNLKCKYGKKYKLGVLSTTYYLSKEESLVVSNKELFNNLKRGLC